MWELLYEEFWDKLEHFCYKLCRDDGKAEDLAQEVFLRALQNQALMESFAPGQCKACLLYTSFQESVKFCPLVRADEKILEATEDESSGY